MKSIKIIAFASFAFFAMALMSASAHAETLTTAVELALRNHPSIQAALFSRSAAAEDIKISKAQNRPRVDVSATNRFSKSRTGTGGALDLELFASQSLYDGGTSKSDLVRSKAELDSEEQRVADQANEVALQVVQAYIDILRANENLRAIHHDLKLLEDIGRRVRLRVSAGFGSDTDMLDVQLKIQNAELNQIDASLQAKKAWIDYRNIVGNEPGELVAIAFPAKAMPPDIETAVELAGQTSPRIKSLLYDASAADAVADGVDASRRPKLAFDVGLNQIRQIGEPWTESHDLSARLVLSVNLYDGGASKAKSRKAKYSAYATRYRAKATALAIEQQLRSIWNALDTGRQRITLLRLQQKIAKRSLVLHLKRFDAGVEPLESILNLQSQSTSADLAEIAERFSNISNGFHLLAGIGKLLPALGLNFAEGAGRNG
jgi:outer membrane protein, adhesin transport system